MDRTCSFISSIFDGMDQSYLYLWVSKAERFVYVGQTNGQYGVYGRGFEHIQREAHGKIGTLRERCSERKGIILESVADLHLLSYKLPKNRLYTSAESSYRIAVEYLVQCALYEQKRNLNPVFEVISNIQSTARVNERDVRLLAKGIVDDFIASYANIGYALT